VPVWHCQESYGLIMFLKSGFKLVYSGDCRPSKDLTREGRHCSMLIHEATFDDSLCDDAVKKKHCTMSEALHVGMQMQAKHIVFTHFSQRYPKNIDPNLLPKLSSSSQCSPAGVTAAYDFLTLDL
jgi:ribonuclease Z